MLDGREVELKLELAPEYAAAVLGHPSVVAFQRGDARTRRLRSVYFDTPEHELLAAGVSLRVRHVEGRRVQTAKCGERAAGGLFERREHEVEIDGDVPRLDVIEDAELRERAAAALAGRVPLALFETDMERVHIDEQDGANRWELALDRGHVLAGSARCEISEVELELVAGDADRLFVAALALVDAFPAMPGGLSKSARGYALTRGERPSLELAAELVSLARALEEHPNAALHRSLAEGLAADAAWAESGDVSDVRSSRGAARRMLEAGRILAAA